MVATWSGAQAVTDHPVQDVAATTATASVRHRSHTDVPEARTSGEDARELSQNDPLAVRITTHG